MALPLVACEIFLSLCVAWNWMLTSTFRSLLLSRRCCKLQLTLVASTLTLKMLSSSLLNVFSKRLRPSQVYKAAFKVSMMVVSLNILLALSCKISVVNSNLAMMPFARPCKTYSRNLVTCWLRVWLLVVMVVQCCLSKIHTVTVLLGLCMTSQALETQCISSHAPLSSLTKKLHNYVQTNVMRWLVSCMNCLINSVHKLLLSPITLGFWATWTSFVGNTSISKIRRRLFQRLVTTKHSNCLTFVTLFWSIQ